MRAVGKPVWAITYKVSSDCLQAPAWGGRLFIFCIACLANPLPHLRMLGSRVCGIW